jgi:hypothetical protein
VLFVSNIPTTVNVLLYAVNVEPTFKVFFVAKDFPISAVYVDDEPSTDFPEVNVTDCAARIVALNGCVDPVMVMGSEKFAGGAPPLAPLPPPNRRPSDPGLIDDLRFVLPPVAEPPKGDVDDEFDSRSLTDDATDTTFFVDEIFVMSAVVSGFPPPLNP